MYYYCSTSYIMQHIFFPNVKRPIAHSAVVGKDKDTAETTAKWVRIFLEEHRVFPTYTVFTTADPTTAVFYLCMCKWGIFALVGDLLQSN